MPEAASVLDTLINGLDPDSDQNLRLGTLLHRDTVIRALSAGKAAIETMNARQSSVANLKGVPSDGYKETALEFDHPEVETGCQPTTDHPGRDPS
jgi:hypothetical protein